METDCECFKETTPEKSEEQPEVTNGSSTKKENPETGGGLQLTLYKNVFRQ